MHERRGMFSPNNVHMKYPFCLLLLHEIRSLFISFFLVRPKILHIHSCVWLNPFSFFLVPFSTRNWNALSFQQKQKSSKRALSIHTCAENKDFILYKFIKCVIKVVNLINIMQIENGGKEEEEAERNETRRNKTRWTWKTNTAVAAREDAEDWGETAAAEVNTEIALKI